MFVLLANAGRMCCHDVLLPSVLLIMGPALCQFWTSWILENPTPLFGVNFLSAPLTKIWYFHSFHIIHNFHRYCVFQIIIYDATLPILYISKNEGSTWTTRNLPSTMNPRSFVWNSVNDHMALAHDTRNKRVMLHFSYVSKLNGQKNSSSMSLKTWGSTGQR